MEHLYTIIPQIPPCFVVYQVRAQTVTDALDRWWREFPIEKDFAFKDFELTQDDVATVHRHLTERLRPLDRPYESCWQVASDFGQDFRYLNWPVDKVPKGVKPPRIRAPFSVLIIDTIPELYGKNA